MLENKKVTVIIVAYNGRHYLSDCLLSLRKQNYPRQLTKIIVIDNDSKDSSVGYVKENFPEVKVIVNKKNVGFAKANNQGYFLAQKNNSDYLFLLNQDTIIEPGCLSSLIRSAENDKKTGAVQAKLLLHPQKHLLNSFGNKIQMLGFAYCGDYKKADQGLSREKFEVPYASGAACLIKMKALAKTALFDDRFFMYHEDVDLGWRFRLAGYKIFLEPTAIVYHKYHFSKAKYKFYYMERNRWLVLLQNYRLATLLILLPALIVAELGLIVFALKGGWLKEKLKSYIWLIFHLPSILSSRIYNQYQLRKVSDKKILSLYTGKLVFEDIKNPLISYIFNPLMSAYFWLVKTLIWW